MATANKTMSATKVVIPCRISFANIFEPKSINGSEAKYSVSCLIPKTDKKILLAIHKAIEAAKEDGKTRKWSGKIPPNLKMPLRDGDIDRPDDENYQEHFFLNATSKDAPQVVDRHGRTPPSCGPSGKSGGGQLHAVFGRDHGGRGQGVPLETPGYHHGCNR